MVKIWGYDPSGGSGTRSKCPAGMFEEQNLRKRKASSGSGLPSGPEKVIMKLPKIYDIQRLTLARHLMYLHSSEVRKGKMAAPKDFEENLKKFRKLGLDVRVGGKRGGVVRGIRRKKREEPVDEEVEVPPENLMTSQRKWDFDKIGLRNVVPEIQRENQRRNYNKKLKKGRRSQEEIEEDQKREEEEIWQRRYWLTRLIRDMKTDRVNEILANYRMVTQNNEKIGHQGIYTICLESAIYALKSHNWAVLCRCLSGMALKFEKTVRMRRASDFPSGPVVFWMLGFLTIINNCKDDVKKVEQFAKDVYKIFGGNPTWIGSQLAVWLVQKGYFMAAYRIVDEYSLSGCHPTSRFRTRSYQESENPKRDLALFLTQLIRSIYLYCVWKKEETLDEEGAGPDENEVDSLVDAGNLRRNALRRKGEAALGAFEICYDKYKVLEGDPMIFLQPFVELVVEFRSVQRAKEILEEVFGICDGNYFVEEFYLEFLEEHFCFEEEDKEVIRFLRGRWERKFGYLKGEQEGEREELKKKMVKGRRQIKQLKDEKKKKKEGDGGGGAVCNFRKVDLPGFSW